MLRMQTEKKAKKLSVLAAEAGRSQRRLLFDHEGVTNNTW
jgi:hypothetical protein